MPHPTNPLPLLESSFQSLDTLASSLSHKFTRKNRLLTRDINTRRREDANGDALGAPSQMLLEKAHVTYMGSPVPEDLGIPMEQIFIKGIEISQLDNDMNAHDHDTVTHDNTLAICRAYRNIPPDVALSSSLRYHRKELERQRAIIMLERTTTVKRRSSVAERKRRNSVNASRRGSIVEPHHKPLVPSSRTPVSNHNGSTQNLLAQKSTVGALNRIAQGRELYARPLAGQKQVDWNRMRLKSAKKEKSAKNPLRKKREMPDMVDMMGEGAAALVKKRRAVSLPAGALHQTEPAAAVAQSKISSARASLIKLQRKLSKGGASQLTPNSAHTAPAAPNDHHLLSSKRRTNIAQQRNIFERLTRINSSLLDGIEEDVSKRSTSLEMDLESLLRSQELPEDNHRTSPRQSSPSHGNPNLAHLRNHYRFKIQLRHEQDIRHLKYHIEFMDLESRRTHREYNKTLSVNNSIVWRWPNDSIFRPFKAFSWLRSENDMRDRTLRIQIKASIGKISPPSPDDALEDEDDIFSEMYRGGVIHMVPIEKICTNHSNFPVPNGANYPTFKFKCLQGKELDHAGSAPTARNGRRRSEIGTNVHSRALLSLHRPVTVPNNIRAPKSERLITDIPYTVSFSPFNEFSPYNPIAHRTVDKKVPHAPSARADSLRPDLSNKNPYAQLRKHPLFRSWKKKDAGSREENVHVGQPPMTAPAAVNTGEMRASVLVGAGPQATQSRLRPVTVPTLRGSDMGFDEQMTNGNDGRDLGIPPLPPAQQNRQHSPPRRTRNRRGSIPDEFKNVEGINKELIRDLEMVPLPPRTVEAAMAAYKR